MPEVVQLSDVIRLDAWPEPHEQFAPYSHKGAGLFVWDPAKIKIFKPHDMVSGKRHKMTGDSMRRRAIVRNPCNAQVLEHLLAHPELIPDDWKEYRRVYFWGTLYKDGPVPHRGGATYVRGLSWEWYGSADNPIHRWVATYKSPAHEHWYSDDCAAAVFAD